MSQHTSVEPERKQEGYGMGQPLWTPSAERRANAQLIEFTRLASEQSGKTFDSYRSLHRWSVEDRESFWRLVWDYCGVIGEPGSTVLVDGDRMPGARFFPE